MIKKHLQLIKNQNNSSELFIQWNKQNMEEIQCSSFDCSNKTEDAYILQESASVLPNPRKFITPLCKECYQRETSSKNQSSSDFTDIGGFITIKESLLLEIM